MVGPRLSPLLLCVPVLSVLTAACSDRTPTAPTPAKPPSSITISSPTTVVVVGSTVALTAIGSFSDGSSRPVNPKWSVDNPSVASIDDVGRLRGIANGVVTVIGVEAGVSASTALRVIPDYRGVWLGRLNETSCSAGDFRTCSNTFPSNAIFTLRLDLQQTSASVQGGFDLDTQPAPGSIAPPRRDVASLSGTIGDDGTLTMEGPVLRNGEPTATMVTRWRSQIAPNGSMTGGFTYFQPSPIASLDPLIVEFELVGLRRTP